MQLPADLDGPIDLHSHTVPAGFPEPAEPPVGWPSIAPAGPGQRHVLIGGKVFRTVAERCWNVPAPMRCCGSSMTTSPAWWRRARGG
jgi:hypothetical protein